MGYIEGFVVAVPTANREAYRQHAAKVVPVLKEHGTLRLVEAWGDDVPDGNVTDFRGAVQATKDETVVFAWFEHESRTSRDAVGEAMRTDPRMQQLGEMPFDGKRMIFGGFTPIVEQGAGGEAGYVDGYLVAVPRENKEAYGALAAEAAEIFEGLGALRTVEAWGDDLPDGKLTDFRRAVKAEPDENVVFSWREWPSQAVRDTAWRRFMEEGAMRHATMPFDGKRLIYGGFVPLRLST